MLAIQSFVVLITKKTHTLMHRYKEIESFTRPEEIWMERDTTASNSSTEFMQKIAYVITVTGGIAGRRNLYLVAKGGLLYKCASYPAFGEPIKYTALSAVEIPQGLGEIMIGDKFCGFDGTKYTVEEIKPDSSRRTVYEVEETEIARYPQEEKAKRIFEDWVKIVKNDAFAW